MSQHRCTIAFEREVKTIGLEMGMSEHQLRSRYDTLFERIGLSRHAHEHETLALLEERMHAADRERVVAVNAVKSMLRDERFFHDQVRAAPSEAQELLRSTLTVDSQRRLAALLREVRLTTAETMLLLHKWRQEVSELVTSPPTDRVSRATRPSATRLKSAEAAKQLAAEQEAEARRQHEAMEQVDVAVCRKMVDSIYRQLDFAPLPTGSDPLLLEWFGKHQKLWPDELPAGEKRKLLGMERGASHSHRFAAAFDARREALQHTRHLFDAESCHTEEELTRLRLASKLLRLSLQDIAISTIRAEVLAREEREAAEKQQRLLEGLGQEEDAFGTFGTAEKPKAAFGWLQLLKRVADLEAASDVMPRAFFSETSARTVTSSPI